MRRTNFRLNAHHRQTLEISLKTCVLVYQWRPTVHPKWWIWFVFIWGLWIGAIKTLPVPLMLHSDDVMVSLKCTMQQKVKSRKPHIRLLNSKIATVHQTLWQTRNLYTFLDKRNYFDVANVNSSFHNGHIHASSTCYLYNMSQLIQYSGACSWLQDFMDQSRALAGKLIHKDFH